MASNALISSSYTMQSDPEKLCPYVAMDQSRQWWTSLQLQIKGVKDRVLVSRRISMRRVLKFTSIPTGGTQSGRLHPWFVRLSTVTRLLSLPCEGWRQLWQWLCMIRGQPSACCTVFKKERRKSLNIIKLTIVFIAISHHRMLLEVQPAQGKKEKKNLSGMRLKRWTDRGGWVLIIASSRRLQQKRGSHILNMC